MQQFHKQSHYDSVDTYKNSSNKCSDSDKLQKLWEKLQDLSEVQDQSRNQQMAIFIDDDSVVSKHSFHDSLFQTAQILQDQSGLYFQNYENVDFISGPFDQQNYQQKIKQIEDKILGQGQVHQKFENKRDQILEETQNQTYKSFQCKIRYRRSQLGQQTGFKQRITNINQLPEAKGGRKEKQCPSQRQKQLGQMNEKLASDNSKLFEECIKLRKLLMIEQSRSGKVKQEGQIPAVNLGHLQQKDQVIELKNQQIEELKWQKAKLLQRVEKLQAQLQKQHDRVREAQLLVRKEAVCQSEKKFGQKVAELEATFKQKQNQIADFKKGYFSLYATNNQLRTQLDRHKQDNQILRNHLLSHQNHLKQQLPHNTSCYQRPISNTHHTISQLDQQTNHKTQLTLSLKPSRTDSIKSTTISISSSVQDKTAPYSPAVESLLKDKDRQITNMKIVHESQIKKYKSIIQNLQSQLAL